MKAHFSPVRVKKGGARDDWTPSGGGGRGPNQRNVLLFWCEWCARAATAAAATASPPQPQPPTATPIGSARPSPSASVVGRHSRVSSRDVDFEFRFSYAYFAVLVTDSVACLVSRKRSYTSHRIAYGRPYPFTSIRRFIRRRIFRK